MIKKFYIPLLIVAMLLSAWCLLHWNFASNISIMSQTRVSLPDKKKDTDTKSGSERLEDEVRPRAKNVDPTKNASGYDLAKLKRDLLISGDKLEDKKPRLRQQEAIRKLAQLRRPDAVALIIEVLLDPQQQYLAKAVTSTGTPYTSSYELMEGLDDCLEGLPEPLNTIYSDEDVPRFASWWQKNKSALRFKAAVGHK